MTSRASRTCPAGLILAGLLLVLGTACSDGDGDPEGAAASPSATARSTGAPSTGTPSAGGEDPTGEPGAGSDAEDVSDIENAQDLAAVMTKAMREAGTAKLALVVKTGGPSIEGTGAVRLGDDPAIQLAATVAGRLVKIRVVGGQAYVSPGMSFNGKSWIKIDAEGTDPASKAFGSLLSALRGLMGASAASTGFDQASSFKDVGTRTVDGVQAQVYVVVLDEEALRAVIGQQLGEASTQPDLSGATATYTISLDDAGRPVRIATKTTFAKGSVENVADYSAWGEPVTINPPPSSQVIDASDVG